MSEQKRATLTSLGSTKKDKKTKELPKTVRFTLTLAESNEEACPEFNYRVLLGSAERKRKATAAAAAAAAAAAGAQGGERDGAAQNGLDPFASDDEDRLKDLARQFEEKYGGGGGGGGGRKRHGRFEDYVDLGAGYDENDPFIDNTDAYDEIVPEEITTAHGGFYINCGQLEFKEVVGLSDGDDDRDLKVKKTLKKPKIKRTPLRGTNLDQPELLRKRKFVSHEREFLKKKKKLAIVDLRKKGQTVKDLLREKRGHLSTTASSKNISTDPAQSPGISPINSPASETKKTAAIPDARKPASATSIVDAIESVVNAAARSNDDSSQDSSSSVSKTGSGSSASSDNSDESQDAAPTSTTLTPVQTPNSLPTPDVKSSSITSLVSPAQLPPGLPTPAASPVSVGSRGDETHLPSDLPSDLVDLLTTLKKAAESSAEGKCKFFSNDVNQTLLRVEQKAQALTCSRRQLVYGHLALYLPCTKDTLMKRAKKLRLNSEELKIKEPMARLEAAVNRMMPIVLEQYTRQCQKFSEEKSNDATPQSDGKETKTRIPRKIFPWNADTRTLLQQVVTIKRQCLLLQKPRKESKEELLRAFLESSVMPLWPPGWMRISILLRESGLRPGGGAPRSYSANIVASPITAVVASPTATTPSATSTPLPGPKMRKSGILKKASASASASPSPLSSQPPPPAPAASPPAPPRAKVEAAAPSPLHPPPPPPPPPASQGRQSPYTNSGSPGASAGAGAGAGAGPAPKAPKSVIERVPSVPAKGLDLSIGAATRAVLSGSPTKLKGGSEISIIPMSGPGRPPPLTPPPVPAGPAPAPPAAQSAAVSAAAGLPLINIPDCISVTPATLPPPPPAPAPAQSAAAPGPRPMSLKQRILLDTGNQRPGPRTHAPQSRPPDDEGIEVIEITEAPPAAAPRLRPDQPRKKPQRPRPDPADAPVPPHSQPPMHPPPPSHPPQPQPPPPQPPPPPHSHAPAERDAETDAATDLLSQIIHDSLSNYPNSGTSGSEAPAPAPAGAGVPSTARDAPPQPAHHRSVIQRPPRGSPPKQPPPKPPPPPLPAEGGGGSGADNVREAPQAADAEVSVQLEVDRVMKELIELQGHISGEKKEAPAPPPPAIAPPPPEPPKISSAVSVVPLPPRGLSTAARTGGGGGLGAGAGAAALPRLPSREPDVTFTPLPRAPPRASAAAAAAAAASGVAGVGPAPPGGAADLAAPRYGHSFQEEFQKHLFQEVRPRNKTFLPNAGTGAPEAKKFW